jgi:uncharacterized protein YkwD
MQGSRIAALGAVAIGLAAAALPSSGAAAPACKASLSPAAEVRLTKLINAQRRAVPVPAVARRAALRRAGRVKSLKMAGGGAFAHSDSLRWAQGRAGGQNIAMAPSAAVAFRTMLKSRPHRRNMLAAPWRFGGVGAARACNGQIFFTVNFLAP